MKPRKPSSESGHIETLYGLALGAIVLSILVTIPGAVRTWKDREALRQLNAEQAARVLEVIEEIESLDPSVQRKVERVIIHDLQKLEDEKTD